VVFRPILTLQHPLRTVERMYEDLQRLRERIALDDRTVDERFAGIVAGVDPIDQITGALRSMVDSALGHDHRHLGDTLGSLERVSRAVEAAVLHILDDAERRGEHRADGHLSLTGWLGSVTRTSPSERRARKQSLRLVRLAPEFGSALARGHVPVASLRQLATALSPRTEHAVAPLTPSLLEAMQTLPVADFARVVKRWEQLADADGVEWIHDIVHKQRHAHLSQVGDEVVLSGSFGQAQAAVMREVWDQFTQAEFAADVDEARRNGVAEPIGADLSRTHAQRRADALYAVFLAAASSSGRTPRPLVNILVDATTFEQAVGRALGARVETALDPERFAHYTCHTTNGLSLSAADVVRAALVGHVRAVVRDSRGRVVHLGRRRRLFAGASREAVWIQGAQCHWPGCGADHCQVDHIESWRESGETSPANGLALCGRHNRWKERGYRVTVDALGRAVVHRPDGSRIDPV